MISDILSSFQANDDDIVVELRKRKT